MTEAADFWSLLLTRARQDLGPEVTKTWLESIKPLRVVDNTLYLATPDHFSLEWADSKYGEFLRSLPALLLGHPLLLSFEVDQEVKTRSQMDFFSTPAITENSVQKQDSIKIPLSDRYTFDQFVIGKSNELAAAVAQAIAQAPGKVYNPFFIYGETGLGKTHLMQAIAHEVIARQPQIRIAYLGSEQFTNEMVTAIQTRTNSTFRRRYREIDLLLIDDIHFLKGKEGTQEEFFHTFNALYEAGRQIVLTSDRPPQEILGLEARLVSRFQWGMVTDIKLPDFEHRIAILQKKASLDHLESSFPESVLEFIASTISSNVRELEGSIVKILAYASLKHRSITLDLAREVLTNNQTKTSAVIVDTTLVTTEQIQEITAKIWGVTSHALCSKSRVKSLTIPRQIAMYFSRKYLTLQLVEIGKAFGNRDHSTVIHSLQRAADMIATDTEILTKAKEVERLIIRTQQHL